MKPITAFFVSLSLLASFPLLGQEKINPEKNEALKTLAKQWVQDNEKLSQVMVDKIFSFSELGFQEEASSKYLTDLLKKGIYNRVRGLRHTNFLVC